MLIFWRDIYKYNMSQANSKVKDEYVDVNDAMERYSFPQKVLGGI